MHSGHSPRALSHPLPAGMRDLLPREAEARRALARHLLEHFALYGYHLVTTPAFEFAEVLERGLGALDPADVLRFVEPESGEVAALRPDVTPQIARMVATRLGREPTPIRLSYEATIVRRRQGRTRRHRQIAQAGVELYGSGGKAGDLETLELACGSLRAAGLEEFVVDVGHASIARALLEPLPSALAGELAGALERRDGAEIEALLRAAPSVPARIGNALVELPELYGGESDADVLFAKAHRLFAQTPAEGAIAELASLFDQARKNAALAARLRLDLGGVRDLAYYTGMIFQLFAKGPGEPIGAGGRYDELLARFDAPMPAVGFALHLDPLGCALEAASVRERETARVVVAGDDLDLVRALRALGIAAISHPAAEAAKFAEAWRFTHIASRDATGAHALRDARGAAPALRFGADPNEAAAAIAKHLRAAPGTNVTTRENR